MMVIVVLMIIVILLLEYVRILKEVVPFLIRLVIRDIVMELNQLLLNATHNLLFARIRTDVPQFFVFKILLFVVVLIKDVQSEQHYLQLLLQLLV